MEIITQVFTEKICTKCKQLKPCSEFYRSKTYKNGYSYACKNCQNAWKKQYEYRHKSRFKSNRRYAHIKLRYGIDKEAYDLLLNKQRGLCAICEKPMGEKVCVDHCHNSSMVRGLLCHNCNVGLGQFKDDPILLDKAKEYLHASIH